MILIPIAAQSCRAQGAPDWRGNRRGCPASMTRLCVTALFGALLSGGALAAFLGSGTIPPNLSSKSSKPAAARAQPARPAKQQLATVPKPAAAVRVAKPSAKPVVKPPVAVKVPVAPKIVVSSSTGGGRLSGGIPPNPSAKSSAAAAPPARPVSVEVAKAPSHATPAPVSKPVPPPIAAPRAPDTPRADRPPTQDVSRASNTTAVQANVPPPSAAGPATTASANPSKTGLNAGAVDKPVRTAYRTGSDGHVITLTSFQRPDGTIYETAISPAASPPPNAAKPTAAPPSPTASKPPATPPRVQQARSSGNAVPRPAESQQAAAAVPQTKARTDSTRDTPASEPIKAAFAPSANANDRRPPAPVDGTRYGRGVIPPDTVSPQRTQEPGPITVMVSEPTSSSPDRTAALQALPLRQGMDVIDRSIGEFDASRTAPADPATGQADALARRQSRQTGDDAAPRAAVPALQSAGDEEASPRNRRSRQARASASRRAPVARAKPEQPLRFGKVTRASFVLARLQTPGTATRGVHILPTAREADVSYRPGAVSGRGVAQVADLGRGSPTYGAAPEVFASAGEPPTTQAVACKPRSSARHVAQRQGKKSRATACS